MVKTRKLQVVIESHSEHLLQRILRRVSEGHRSPYPAIVPEDIRLYFCQTENGSSKIDKLFVNLFGVIKNWPPDFFGDQLGEIAAREEAALLRRIAGE